jgi:8-hydroxy-5-deazaflavin:NADPH oxidoreductase
MRIGVLGSGRMGAAVGAALARAGHDVAFGARDAGRPLTLRGIDTPVETVTYAGAAAYGEVLILAVHWTAAREVVSALAPCTKVLLSCTNPETDEAPLAVGFHTSAAEEIQSWSGGARVVEALNYIYAERLDVAPELDQRGVTVALCGDDDEARAVAASLIHDLRFDPLDAGPLRNARYLEPLAQLVVYLVREQGLGPLGLTVTFKR